MLQEFKIAYDLKRRVRYLTWAGLGSVTLFLLWAEGGFPPLAWRLLAQEIRQLPTLWAGKGASVLLPLVLLAVLSLLWLLSWSLLLWLSLTLLWPRKPDSRHVAWREARNLNVREVLQLDENPFQEDTVNIPKLTLPHKAHLAPVGTDVSRPSRQLLPDKGHNNLPVGTASSRPSRQLLSNEGYVSLVGTDVSHPSRQSTPDPRRENHSVTDSSRSHALPIAKKDAIHPSLQGAEAAQKEQRPVLVSVGAARKENPTTPLPLPARTWQRQRPDSSIDDVPTTPERTSRTGKLATRKQTRLNVGVGWNSGITRRQRPNEDSLIVLQGMCTYNDQLVPFGLFVVADGMGGHDFGQEASHIAIQCMMQTVLHDIVASASLNDTIIIELLVNGVEKANTAICQRCRDYGKDMGTTLTATLVVDAKAYVVNVGDSRTYLYDNSNGLSQITLDHSLVANLVMAGVITPEEVYTHPERNKVYRSLGNRDGVEVDWFTRELRHGDSLLLCSDGLWEMVRDPDISRILASNADPTVTCERLVQAALHGGGADNVSAIVVEVE